MIHAHELPVERVMSPAPTCIHEGMSLASALSFLLRERYQSAPVRDREGRLVGLVTRTGLLTWLSETMATQGTLTLRELSLERPVSEVVEPPLRLPAGTRLDEAARRLVEAEAPAALVQAGDQVVGILTLLDCTRALAHAPRAERARGRGHCFTPDGLPEGDERPVAGRS